MLAVIDMLVFTYQCLINEREQIILEDLKNEKAKEFSKGITILNTNNEIVAKL